jgi:hypothetical protein
VQIHDAYTSNRLARERHAQLASEFAAASARRSTRRRRAARRRRLLAALRPRAA